MSESWLLCTLLRMLNLAARWISYMQPLPGKPVLGEGHNRFAVV